MFGLHTNADITYQTKTTSDVLETIVNIQPKDSSGGSGETRESLVARQATEMLDKLPSDYVPFEVKLVVSFHSRTFSMISKPALYHYINVETLCFSFVPIVQVSETE